MHRNRYNDSSIGSVVLAFFAEYPAEVNTAVLDFLKRSD
jgi:hypothetical protein